MSKTRRCIRSKVLSLFVCALCASCSADVSRSASALHETPSLLVAHTELLASDRADYDQAGWSVAVSGDGNTALVGAIAGSDATGEATTGNGAAYVFVRNMYSWSQQAKLIAADKADLDFLGSSVALSRDGNTAIVGAMVKNDDAAGTVQSGAAYVFVRSGATWKQQAKLVAPDAKDFDHFGAEVALSSDGNTALISALWAGDPARATTLNGAVYVFTRASAVWSESAKLVAKDHASSDFFGISVALSGAGDVALIGAYQTDDAVAKTSNNGSAYVFERAGSSWVEKTKLTARDKASGAYFGCSVSLSENGNLALIGAFGVSDSPTDRNGAAYLFGRSPSGFTQQFKFLAPDRIDGASFGLAVSLSGDGQGAFIGAPDHAIDPEVETGRVYLFERSASGWPLRMALSPVERTDYDHFGASVAISGDRRQALAGAPNAIDNSGATPIASGIGYLYFR